MRLISQRKNRDKAKRTIEQRQAGILKIVTAVNCQLFVHLFIRMQTGDRFFLWDFSRESQNTGHIFQENWLASILRARVMFLVSEPVDRCILSLFHRGTVSFALWPRLLCVLATLKHAANDHDNVFISRFPRPVDCSRRESRFLSSPCFFAIIARVILVAGKKARGRRGKLIRHRVERASRALPNGVVFAIFLPPFEFLSSNHRRSWNHC